MNEFFGTQYSQQDLQQKIAERRGRNALSRTSSMSAGPQSVPQGGNGSMGMTEGATLDDIIMANKEIQRRQSYTQGFPVEFGAGNEALNGFQFDGQQVPPAMVPNMRRQSTGELEMGDSFGDMGPPMNMNSQGMAYHSSMHGRNPLTINTNSPFDSMTVQNFQNLIYTPMTMEGIEGMTEEDQNAMSMFSTTFAPPFVNGMDNMGNDFSLPQNMQDNMGDMGGSGLPNLSNGSMVKSPQNMSMKQSMGAFNSPVDANMASTVPSQEPNRTESFAMPAAESKASPLPKPEDLEAVVKAAKPAHQGIYSQSGFDMLGALLKVATRKNPEIEIGKVDMSCAFVVCDITLFDCPIIYVSDIFERLTGYNKHEVKGQNCRFLQSPEGKVEAGARREFTDNDSVYYLKRRIANNKEAQRSIINYRKGGQPFMNLLTMIPITGEDNETFRYIVGFQVDVVEKPNSVEATNASGMYTVDYSQSSLPRYVWNAPEGGRPPLDGGQTISRDDVSTVLNSINNGTESELTKRMWDKLLLENTDDVVHVLSLKGLFLYLSPSSRHVLEYDASELVGTALSSICHPSDIVPVTRELKDTSTGAPVNVVFRIRRKKSGYTWFESHGSLCVEQGKGRKCIILVGRERPVYAIHRRDLESAGGIGETEIWTKLSTSGMFLFVSSNIRTLLDQSPEGLVGTSIQGLMRAESKVEFGRALEKARAGRRVTHKHEIFNKRGIVMQAQTTLYPGDASEGQKPTFLVGQTRLLKTSSRPALSASQSSKPVNATPKDPLEDATAKSIASQGSSLGQETPRSNHSAAGPITQAGSSGLALGQQDVALASEDNIFDELKTTRCTSWQFELRQMEKSNRLLAEELAALLSNKKKRKRRKGAGHLQRDCANCHTRVTPEWRRGPSGQRDLCNSCGLRWAKQTGRVSPRTSTRGDKHSHASQSQHSASPQHSSPLQEEMSQSAMASMSNTPNLNREEEKARNVRGEGAAVPNILGGRTTSESQPVHKPSVGFREGGERGIVSIEEEGRGYSHG